MFAKLLKQEWKATFKLMGIMSLAALGASILEAVVLRMLVTAGDTAAGSLIWGTIGSLIVFLSLIIVVSVFSACSGNNAGVDNPVDEITENQRIPTYNYTIARNCFANEH